MKTYSDEGVIPQNLFKHKVAPEMSGLFSNVEMMLEVKAWLQSLK